MREGAAATCERCGAPLALAQGGKARCVFCLHAQPLPAHVAQPLAESARLSAELDAAERAAGALGKSHYAIWVILGINIPGLALAGAAIFGAALTQQNPVGTLMFAALGIGGLLPFIAIPIAWIRTQNKAKALSLAGLPLAVPRVEAMGLVCVCPNCGAPEPAGADRLTVVCGHCRTEALLPLPMVGARLARKHQEVLSARQLERAGGQAGMLAVQLWQREVLPWFFGFVTLFGILLVVFVVLAKMTTP